MHSSYLKAILNSKTNKRWNRWKIKGADYLAPSTYSVLEVYSRNIPGYISQWMDMKHHFFLLWGYTSLCSDDNHCSQTIFLQHFNRIILRKSRASKKNNNFLYIIYNWAGYVLRMWHFLWLWTTLKYLMWTYLFSIISLKFIHFVVCIRVSFLCRGYIIFHYLNISCFI
jgi:hypothetical protein